MRYCCLLLLSTLPALTVTLDVARLPAPSFADGEVSGDASLPASRTSDLRTFRLEMTFESTPSNNVQVAFGRDTMPADGFLAAEETDFIVGWDCGEWFLRPQGLADRHTFTPAVTNGTRTLSMEIPAMQRQLQRRWPSSRFGRRCFSRERVLLQRQGVTHQ